MLINHTCYGASIKPIECASSGAPFKPSVKKGHKEVEFAPTNLHLHRIWVQNTTTNTSRWCIRLAMVVDIVWEWYPSYWAGACYDIITVGAFTAYPHKFKHGGLRRLLQQLKEHVTEVEEGKTRLERASEVLANMEAVRAEVDELCEALCRAAMNSEAAELQGCAKRLADKTHQLVQVCEDNLVEEGITECLRACAGKVNPKQRPQSEPFVSAVHQGGGRSAAKSWKWSGTDFVKSPTEEPWVSSSTLSLCQDSDILQRLPISAGADSTQHGSQYGLYMQPGGWAGWSWGHSVACWGQSTGHQVQAMHWSHVQQGKG